MGEPRSTNAGPDGEEYASAAAAAAEADSSAAIRHEPGAILTAEEVTEANEGEGEEVGTRSVLFLVVAATRLLRLRLRVSGVGTGIWVMKEGEDREG